MSNHTDIKQALSMHLAASVNDWPVHRPNYEFSPGEHDNFLKMTFLPGDTEQVSLGENGLNRNYGVLQIGIFVPFEKGWKLPSEKADEICEIYKRGMTLINDDVEVNISNVYVRPGKPDDDVGKYFVPVIINYWADTVN